MKILCFILWLSYLTPVICQEAAVPSQFQAAEYVETQRMILEKVSRPGSYPGRIALNFADKYNATAKAFPEDRERILDLTKGLADSFNIEYNLDNGIMTTAKFRNPDSFRAVKEQSDAIVPSDPPPSKPKEVFVVVEQMPRFPGCEDVQGTNEEKYLCSKQRMMDYVNENLQYPAAAREQGIEGRVVVKFVVDKQGAVSDIQCLVDIGGGCGDEIVRIVNTMNTMKDKWTPGLQRGTPVEVQINLPVEFKL